MDGDILDLSLRPARPNGQSQPTDRFGFGRFRVIGDILDLSLRPARPNGQSQPTDRFGFGRFRVIGDILDLSVRPARPSTPTSPNCSRTPTNTVLDRTDLTLRPGRIIRGPLGINRPIGTIYSTTRPNYSTTRSNYSRLRLNCSRIPSKDSRIAPNSSTIALITPIYSRTNPNSSRTSPNSSRIAPNRPFSEIFARSLRPRCRPVQNSPDRRRTCRPDMQTI